MDQTYYIHSTGIIKGPNSGGVKGYKNKARQEFGNLFFNRRDALAAFGRVKEALNGLNKDIYLVLSPACKICGKDFEYVGMYYSLPVAKQIATKKDNAVNKNTNNNGCDCIIFNLLTKEKVIR